MIKATGGSNSPNGEVRSMWFDATNNSHGGGEADGFTFNSRLNIPDDLTKWGSGEKPNMGSIGRDRDWSSDSLYITKNGEPIVYSAENNNAPDGGSGDGDTFVWQVYDTRNFAVNQQPHPVTAEVTTISDTGPGSLRDAIAYGGRITFAPELSGPTIRPVHEVLFANMIDLAPAFTNEFEGMTKEAVPFDLLSKRRKRLFAELPEKLGDLCNLSAAGVRNRTLIYFLGNHLWQILSICTLDVEFISTTA